MAPNGNKKKLISSLRNAATDWGAKIRAGHLSKQEAWTALRSNISMKLKYPIAACTLTQTECNSIMAPATQAALPKVGISSTISSAVRNAPNSSGGLDILNLYTHMDTARTSMIVFIEKEGKLNLLITKV